MDSGNSVKPPVAQLVSSQVKQRKRPLDPPQSPLMSSPESEMANSRHMEVGSASQEARHLEVGSASQEPRHLEIGSASQEARHLEVGSASQEARHMEAGSASREAPQKSAYEAWTETSEAQLFAWLETPGNYGKWKCAGIRSPSGSTRASGLTKKAVTCLISEFLDTVHTKKSPDQVMSKMRYMEKKFKEAEDYLRNTGNTSEGSTSNDKKLGIPVIREKVVSICPFYFRVKPFMSESVAVNPSYVGETGMNVNINGMLIGTSTGQVHCEPIAQEAGDGNFEEEDSSAREEPDFEVEPYAEQEPTPEAPSQGTSLVPETTQCTPNPSGQRKVRKKNPKSIQESVQEMQEQNRSLIERKLDIQSAHQDELLRFLREQSEKQFALESRRLDLEFMRMKQQREDSRIRELALQVELAKLRAKS